MLIGLPASGKSTFRSKFTEAYPGHVVVSSDDFIEAYAAEHLATYSDVFESCAKDADKHCRALFAQALHEGSNIIIDRTNLNPKSRKSFLSQVPTGYVKQAILFDVDPDVLDTRLDERAEKTGKNIPASVVRNMRSSFVAPSSEEFDLIMKVIQ